MCTGLQLVFGVQICDYFFLSNDKYLNKKCVML